jgi:hypothetical protein
VQTAEFAVLRQVVKTVTTALKPCKKTFSHKWFNYGKVAKTEIFRNCNYS